MSEIVVAAPLQQGDNTNTDIVILTDFCGGYGQYHTNEFNPNKPNRILKPYIDVSPARIIHAVDNPLSTDKGAALWVIPSMLASRNFKLQEEYGRFWFLWFDYDVGDCNLDELKRHTESIIGICRYEIYTTSSATITKQKARVIIWLSTLLTGYDWILFQKILNDKFEALGITPDRASERAAQLCYMPNKGEYYDTRSNRIGAIFNPLETFSEELHAKKLAIAEEEKIVAERRAVAAEKRAALKYTGSKNNDLIGAFNSAYTVEDILLRAGYKQRGLSFCHPNSDSGSYSASINIETGRVNALSPNDPLYTNGAGAHDAFGAFAAIHHGGQE